MQQQAPPRSEGSQESQNQIPQLPQYTQENQNKLLISTMVEFYSKMRNPSSMQIKKVEKSFIQCQKKIIKVVEFRKDLQSTYLFSELNKSHLQEFQKVQQNCSNFQETITELLKIIQAKQNYILQLELQINKFRLKQAQFKKMENTASRQAGRFQENLKQIKATFINFVEQLRKPANTLPCVEAIGEDKQTRDFLKNKQILVESKVKFMKMQEQIIECSEVQKKKYTQSLKEAINLYEQLLRKKTEEGMKKRNRNHRDEIALKEQEYNRLCRTQLTLYEKELNRMQEVCLESKNQLEKMMVQAATKDSTILLLESELDKSKQVQQQQAIIFAQKLEQLNQIICQLSDLSKEQGLQLENYQTKVINLENQVEELVKKERSAIGELGDKNRQIVELMRQGQVKNNLVTMLRLQLDSLRKENMDYKQSLQKTSQIDSKLAKQEVRLKKLVKKLQEQLKYAQEEKEQNNRQLSELKHKAMKKQILLQQLTHELGLHSQHIAKLEEQKVKLKQLAEHNKIQILKKNNTIDKLWQQVQYLGSACQELKQQYKLAFTNRNFETGLSEEGREKIKEVLELQIEKQWVKSKEELEEIMGGIYTLLQLGDKQKGGRGVGLENI